MFSHRLMHMNVLTRVVMRLRKPLEPSGSRALLKEVCHWGKASTYKMQAPLPVLTLCFLLIQFDHKPPVPMNILSIIMGYTALNGEPKQNLPLLGASCPHSFVTAMRKVNATTTGVCVKNSSKACNKDNGT